MKKLEILLLALTCLITMTWPAQAEEGIFQEGFFKESLFHREQESFGFASQNAGLSAESYVAALAYEEERERKIGGLCLTGFGLALIGMGAYYGNDGNDLVDYESAYYLSGGILSAVGLCVLAIPGYVESEYKRVMQIEDPLKREQVSYVALMHIADRERLSRLSTGAVSGALCLYYLTADSGDYGFGDDYNTYNALLHGALCAYSFLVQSSAEKMLQEYQANQEFSRSGMSFALVPKIDGSLSAVCSYSF